MKREEMIYLLESDSTNNPTPPTIQIKLDASRDLIRVVIQILDLPRQLTRANADKKNRSELRDHGRATPLKIDSRQVGVVKTIKDLLVVLVASVGLAHPEARGGGLVFG